MSHSFAEKYRAKSYKEIIGQKHAIIEIEKFLREFPKPEASQKASFGAGNVNSRAKKALLLYGPPGVGKTTLAWVAALEHDLDVLELNSSDLRNRIKLEETLKPASQQASLFKRGKILIMDEVDGVTGTDIGGVPELIRIIEKTAHPIILTGNDVWQSKFSSLRPKCKLVEMKSLNTEEVVFLMKNVLQKENVNENEHFLKQIAIKSQGDLRAALNDLQAYSIDGIEPHEKITDERRDREESIFNILKILFQERKDFLDLFDNTEMSLDEILLWIEENIPKEYKGEALVKAYEALAQADKFRGRIYRQQFWRFLLYQNIFQSAGISYAKDKPTYGFTKYERPKRILKIWLNNQKTAKKKTIAQKYAKHVHCSTKRAMKDFPLIQKIIKNNPNFYQSLKLTDEEIAFVER